MAAMEHVEVDLPAGPHAPGPFAFADSDYVRGILDASGYEAIAIDPLHIDLTIGGGAGLDDAVRFMLQLGPVGRILQGAEPDTRSRVLDSVRKALEPYETAEGVTTPSAAWIVTARRPA